jgi:Tfp pilus assembly protein PilZ
MWRFPKKDDPFSGGSRLILSSATEQENRKESTNPSVMQNTAYPKKRRYPRYPVREMNVRAHLLFVEEINLCNLSLSGACVRTLEEPRVGEKYLLRIRDEKISRAIRCSVVWKRESSSNSSVHKEYTAGLQFYNMASDDIVLLKDYMRISGTPIETMISDDFSPSLLRFSFATNTKAVLKYPKSLNVKTISLGGMLIESERAPKIESHYLMKLPLPREPEPIRIKGRVACVIPWKESRNTRFDIGVEFLTMEESDRGRLYSFIQSL